MKYRLEREGLHLYDRGTGVHILVDELEDRERARQIAPRTFSIAITDDCDFTCPHCHVPRGAVYLDPEYVVSIGKEFDRLGAFDIAIGGGEPTLHPHLPAICRGLFESTRLGVSVTTHGQRLGERLIGELEGLVSLVRVSVDGVGGTYERLRRTSIEPLIQILGNLSGRIPFGFNVVVDRRTISSLDGVADLAVEFGAQEMLLLPMTIRGEITLSPSDWSGLDEWIGRAHERIPLRISSSAIPFLNCPFLLPDLDAAPRSFAYFAVDRTLRASSHSSSGIDLRDHDDLESALSGLWHSIEC